MFRNQYDYDVTIWSPQGRLHQIEYAMEAVKQGSACVGIKGANHSVVVAVKRSFNELASFQKKIYEIDDHIGVSIAGLTADAREINNYLQGECLDHRYAYKKPAPISRLVNDLGNMMQAGTQGEDKRPYGVGLLLIGYDHRGPHLYQIDPSSNYFECKAMSIGARSQSARTYLEKFVDEFSKISSIEENVFHALRALRNTLANEEELSKSNVSVAIVGEKQAFKVYSTQELEPIIDKIVAEERKPKVRVDPEISAVDEDRPPAPAPPPDVDVATEAAAHTHEMDMD